MPYSSDEGKRWIREGVWHMLESATPRIDLRGEPLLPRVLDVGAGSGTYAKLIAGETVGMVHMIGIEVHAPYVERFGLNAAYDELIIGDVREVAMPQAEVVILGDVLEHMPFDDALEVWTTARYQASLAVFLSLPIVEWPQGESEGNPHEAHVEVWSHQRVLAELDGIIAYEVGKQVGVYQAKPRWGRNDW